MEQVLDAGTRIASAEARASIYRLLARALAYPHPDVAAALVDEDLPEASAAAEQLGEEIAAPLAAFGHRLAHAGSDGLARAFERAFTHISSPDWPPYETAYTSKGVFQQANDLADVAGFYAAYGMQISSDAHERPDHVSVEAEFLYLLAFKEAHALRHHGVERADGCLADQRAFFTDHLGRWGGEFARRLAPGAAGTPYADLAELLGAFLAQEAGRLEASPAPVPGTVEVAEPEQDGCWAECVFRPAEAAGAIDA